MSRRRETAWLVLAAAVAVAGCRTPPAVGPETPPSTTVRLPRDLASRPLYTFSESEVDRYLRILPAAEPDLPRRVVHLGRKNIGQPYEIYLLGEFPFEFYDPDPIYCLDRSDCLVFCEHMYALALSRDWWTFLRTLQRLRYRDGIIGMVTRNHYTIADWDRNNAYLFEDLTAQLGGGRACVPLRQVCRRANFFKKYELGQDIPDEPVRDHYIPKENVPGILAELRDGDFVNIIRGNADSQFAGHTGLIALAADGGVDFLHSCVPVVKEQPLTEYLAGDRRCLGIKILRLRPDADQIMRETLINSPQATDVSPISLVAALAASPLMSTGAPDGYAANWTRAMRMQSYRLTYDTPLDPELQAALEQLDHQVAEQLGMAAAPRAFGVLDLTDLRLALVHPDDMFYGASVPKICILLAYFETHPEAAEHLDPAVERELQLMIKRSDNQLAAKYSQLVGIEKIQEILQSKRYRFYDQEHGGGFWCGKHYGIAEPRYGDPVHDHSHGATVRQCLRYYLMLEQGQLVSAAACAKMKQIFAAPELEFNNEDFVRGLSGRDVTILRKGGLWEDWHLDTARVQHGGRLYLLAGMTQHARGHDYLAGMAAGVDDVLCGPQPLRPFRHDTILRDGPGVVLQCSGDPPAAEYESAVIEPAIRFNEVLLSWNVVAPAGSGFCVELRVGRPGEDTWTPWLYVGDWGDTVPAGPRLTSCDAGRIDVDYFRSDERFDRLQYRIRAAGMAGREAALVVQRVAVCVSDLTGIPPAIVEPRPAVAPPPDPTLVHRRLPVPFRNQSTDRPELAGRICSPASLSMLLAYRGVNVPTGHVAAACYDPTHDIYGNWPRAIQAAFSFGVPGYLTRFCDWNDVERMIAAGQPLIISIRVGEADTLTGAPYQPTGGHVLVVSGFDAAGNVMVNDPALGHAEQGELVYLRSELERFWMRATGGTAYVLLPRT